ncbi:MAG: hypothetical protein H0T79_01040 [Deltaproteobacteria bacterium]|nr:hypothetical protein [Deltaproteobacteria bacterium]
MIEYDPRRWRSHFFDLRGSMVREIGYRVGLCALTAVAASLLHHYGLPSAMSDKPHLMVGPALALLLVFRTNTANDRYWEGRRLWGGIVNSARNLRRKAAVLIAEPATVERLVEWSILFAWATRAHLIDRRAIGESSRLSAEDQAAALAAPHIPILAAERLTAIITDAKQRGVLTDVQQVAFDLDVQALVDHLGGCERIDSTPLPFAYAVHLRRALVLYCVSLPFALVSTFGEWSALVTFVIAYILIGIEEIGAEIEGPFGVRYNDLPLDAICTRLQDHLRATTRTAS